MYDFYRVIMKNIAGLHNYLSSMTTENDPIVWSLWYHNNARRSFASAQYDLGSIPPNVFEKWNPLALFFRETKMLKYAMRLSI